MSLKRNEVVNYLNNKLSISEIEDVSNNGLQVEGVETVSKIGLAVDACMDVYKKAVDANCDMLITHHGLIWEGIKYVTGRSYRHVRFLIEHRINLYAAHIPLDMHADVGNNIELARLIGLKSTEPFGEYKGNNIGVMGNLKNSLSVGDLSDHFQKRLSGTSVILPFGKETNKSVGIVSGGAAGSLNEAIEKNLDCFVTGEGNYSSYHLAKESGINVLFLGHYHSEKLGVQAIGKDLEKKFGLETLFIDEPAIVNHF